MYFRQLEVFFFMSLIGLGIKILMQFLSPFMVL